MTEKFEKLLEEKGFDIKSIEDIKSRMENVDPQVLSKMDGILSKTQEKENNKGEKENGENDR